MRLQITASEESKPHLLLSPPGRPHPVPGLFFAPRAPAPGRLFRGWTRAAVADRFATMRVLAADVGGTKTLAAIVEIEAKSLSLVRQRRYASAEHGSLGDILEDFLAEGGPAPRFAGAGVAGP